MQKYYGGGWLPNCQDYLQGDADGNWDDNYDGAEDGLKLIHA